MTLRLNRNSSTSQASQVIFTSPSVFTLRPLIDSANNSVSKMFSPLLNTASSILSGEQWINEYLHPFLSQFSINHSFIIRRFFAVKSFESLTPISTKRPISDFGIATLQTTSGPITGPLPASSMPISIMLSQKSKSSFSGRGTFFVYSWLLVFSLSKF